MSRDVGVVAVERRRRGEPAAASDTDHSVAPSAGSSAVTVASSVATRTTVVPVTAGAWVDDVAELAHPAGRGRPRARAPRAACRRPPPRRRRRTTAGVTRIGGVEPDLPALLARPDVGRGHPAVAGPRDHQVPSPTGARRWARRARSTTRARRPSLPSGTALVRASSKPSAVATPARQSSGVTARWPSAYQLPAAPWNSTSSSVTSGVGRVVAVDAPHRSVARAGPLLDRLLDRSV